MVKQKDSFEKKKELIYVIAGKEASLVGMECERLVNELLGPQERATGFFKADPAQVSAVEVLDELRTMPFLSEKRVVVVKGADKFISENRGPLEKYFDNPSPTGRLILTVSNWQSNTKLAGKLGSVGRLISVTEPKGRQLAQRLIRYANDAHGKNLSRQGAEFLMELAGDESGRLYSEIDKLALFADKEKAITVKHIELLIGHNRFFNAFSVIGAVTAGQVTEAVERLRNMFAVDKSTEYTVVGAFAFHLRRMFGAKALLEKGVGTAEVARRMRIWGNREKFFAQLRSVSLKQLGDNLCQLAATDYAIKTGRTKPQVAIEQLVLRLAGF